MGGMMRAAAIGRGVLALLTAYIAASWMVLLSYDASPFDAGYRWRSWLFGAHVPLLLALLAAVWLLGLYREFRIERDGVDASTARRIARRRELGGAAVMAAAIGGFVVWASSAQPVVLDGGLPGLRPSSAFSMDQLSRRPTIWVRTNEHGFRDRPWRGRTDGGWRVLVVGDSIVFGSGITRQGETLTPVLERTLRARGMADARTFDVSFNGLNFRQEVALVDRWAHQVRPQLLLVLHNTQNDLMPVLPYYDRPALLAAFPLAFISYVSSLDRWMTRHPLSEAPGRLAGFRRDLDRLAAIAGRERMDVLFVHLHSGCPAYLPMPHRAAGTAFAFATVGDWGEQPGLTFPNDFHPTPRGVRWMAGKLAPAIVQTRADRASWAAARTGTDPLTSAVRAECARREHRRNGPAPDRRPVLAAGIEARVEALFAPSRAGSSLADGWTLAEVRVEARAVAVRLVRGEERAALAMEPREAVSARWRSTSFAMRPEGAPGATGVVETLARRVVANDHGGFWSVPR